jgi:hypothetical protein
VPGEGRPPHPVANDIAINQPNARIIVILSGGHAERVHVVGATRAVKSLELGVL